MGEVVKKCEACGINEVSSNKAIRCPSCQVALRKAKSALAVYKHRMRAAAGRARHNTTYKGKPTRWVIEQAIEVLQRSGVIRGDSTKVRERLVEKLERASAM